MQTKLSHLMIPLLKNLVQEDKRMEKSAHKLELLKRIAELEKQELWHLDVEDDPETYPLMPDKIDLHPDRCHHQGQHSLQ